MWVSLKKPVNQEYLNESISILEYLFRYFEIESLTDEERDYRIRVMNTSLFTYLTLTLTAAPMMTNTISSLYTTSIERTSTQNVNKKLILSLQAGKTSISEFIVKILFIWTMSENHRQQKGF